MRPDYDFLHSPTINSNYYLYNVYYTRGLLLMKHFDYNNLNRPLILWNIIWQTPDLKERERKLEDFITEEKTILTLLDKVRSHALDEAIGALKKLREPSIYTQEFKL